MLTETLHIVIQEFKISSRVTMNHQIYTNRIDKVEFIYIMQLQKPN